VLQVEVDFRPWKPHHVQKLTPEDCDRRMEYGELMLGWHKDKKNKNQQETYMRKLSTLLHVFGQMHTT
jgi:hypothetical protein